jgi:hypothetical protein
MRDPADLLASLAGLPAGPAADAAAARAIAALEPAQAAHALKVLVESAKSSPEAGQALAAASRAIMFGSEADLPFAHRGRIYDAAVEFGIPEVAALFAIDKPSKVLDPSAGEPPEAELARLTLGHKKMLARKAEPDRMARLAVEGDGRVIRELLLNPKLTEGVVIRMAARRPAKVEALVEIWHSPKWSVRYSVRKALAMNPYTPPEISLKILPHLMQGDLKMISADRALHATVRELAQKLAGRTGRRGA